MRSKSRAGCSQPIPHFTTTFSGTPCLRSNSACGATCTPGPLNTYRGWLEKKRQVRKGERGITLCMPMPFKKAAQTDSTEEEETTDPQTRYAFRFRAYWFVLAQTEGEETYVAPIPGFDMDTALHSSKYHPHTV